MQNDKWEIARKPNQEIVGIKYNGISIDVASVDLAYNVNYPHPILTMQVPALDIVFTEVPDA